MPRPDGLTRFGGSYNPPGDMRMSFTVDDFQDLIRLLGEHPEWRAELRRHVLSDELLALPDLVRQIGEQLAALTERVDQLAEAQTRTEEQLAALARRMDDVAAAQVRTEAHLGRLADDVGGLKGEVLELRYRVRAGAYFSRLARRLRVLESTELADLLDDSVDEQRLTDTERHAILAADLVLSGRRREDGAPIYLVVEVSVGIGLEDVERAASRGASLARLGQAVMPVVAGHWITWEAAALAKDRGVQQVLDGRLEP